MRYHYSLVPGDEPIVRDMPVYSSVSIANGALMMLGSTDPDSNADQGISLIPAYSNGSSASTCVDVVGILQDATYVSVSPGNVYATNTNGANYGKVIINPFAVYLAENLQDTANDEATGTSSSTNLEITNIEDDIDGGWVFFTKNATTSNKYSLRFITADDGSSLTLDSAPPVTASSSDTVIVVRPQNHRLANLDASSTGLKSISTATGPATSLHVVENYIQSNGRNFQPLRKKQHQGKKEEGGQLYSDLVMLDHIYNNQS